MKFYFLLFFLALGRFIFAQTDSTALRYYRFVLADSSVIVGSVVLEDENTIQIKSVEGKEVRVKKSEVKKRSPIAPALIEEMKKITPSPDSTVVVRLELRGGSELMGRIVAEDSTVIKMRLLSGADITINKKDIDTREIMAGEMDGEDFFFEDPNATRLFFGPTGRGLKSGKGYFAVYELFFPMVAIGLGDFVSFAGGFSLFPGMSEQLGYLAPKVTIFQNQTSAVAIGDFFLFNPGNKENVNILYSVGTYTVSRISFTGGVGYEFSSQKLGMLVGIDARVSKYVKFVTENWFFSGSDLNFISIGVRFMGRHVAADFAFVIPTKGIETTYVPWIGLAYNF